MEIYEDTKEDLEAFVLAILIVSIGIAIIARFLFKPYFAFYGVEI